VFTKKLVPLLPLNILLTSDILGPVSSIAAHAEANGSKGSPYSCILYLLCGTNNIMMSEIKSHNNVNNYNNN
jgi:hypothetical protein